MKNSQIPDQINETSLSKTIKSKNKSRKPTLIDLNDEPIIDKAMQLRIAFLQEENFALKKELKTLTENQSLINEKGFLAEKYSIMNGSVKSSRIGFNRADEGRQEHQLKQLLSEKESEIEILNLNLDQRNKECKDISEINSVLKNYSKNQKQMQDSQLSDLLFANKALIKDKDELESKVAFLKSEVDSLNERINDLSTKIACSHEKEEMKSSRKEKKSTIKKIEELHLEAESLRSELLLRDSKINELKLQLSKSQEEIEVIRTELLDYDSMKIDFEHKLASLEKIKQAYKNEIEKKDDELANERAFLKDKLEELTQLESKNSELTKQLIMPDDQKNKVNMLEKELDNKSKDFLDCSKKLDETVKQLNDSKYVLDKKKNVIANKKKATNSLLAILKLKSTEIRYIEALKLMPSSESITEELDVVKIKSTSLSQEVNNLISLSDFTDSEGEEEESEPNQN